MMQKQKKRLITVLLLFLISSTVYSSVVDELYDRHWIKKAELIFSGEVVKIEYKSSQVLQRGDIPIPHTFVTCLVTQVYKGIPPEDKFLTLRFQGGQSDSNPELFLDVKEIPLFNVGDRGVFCVRMNGTAICPLVGFYQGFIRFQNGKVLNGIGQELRQFEDPLTAIHPYDILDLDALTAKINQPSRAVDEILRVNLDQSLRIIQNPTFAAKRFQFANDPMRKMIPLELQIPILTPDFSLFVNNLNQTLKQRQLFTPTTTRGLSLRPSTESLLQKDQSLMSNRELTLLNRRVLEDSFPDIIVKVPEYPILPIGNSLLSQSYLVGGNRFQQFIFDEIGEGGKGRAVDYSKVGSLLTEESFTKQLTDLIPFLHTDQELKNLPAVQNLNIADDFSVTPLLSAVPAPTIQEIIPDPVTGQEIIERTLLLDNNFDPRIQN